MEVIAVLGFWLTLLTFCYMYFTTRHKERMTLIEKGMTIDVFEKKKRSTSRFSALKLGMLLLTGGIGLLVGNILAGIFNTDPELPVFTSLMIFGGLGLMYYYKYTSKFDELEKNIDQKEEKIVDVAPMKTFEEIKDLEV